MQERLELLKIYHSEWMFRQENLWKRLIQFVIIIFFTSTLPVTIHIFESVSLPNIPMEIFPIVGLLLIVFFVWFCLAESARINSLDSKIKLIIADCFPSRYGKSGLIPFSKKRKEALRIFQWKMAIWVPLFLASIEMLISLVMLYVVVTKKL